MIKKILLWWQRGKTRRKMDRVFSRGRDPYGYATLPYELGRLTAMEKAVGGRLYTRALEVGCAEGIFTEKLAPRCERLIALDLSSVALARAKSRLSGADGVSFVEADIRDWSPAGNERFDLIVLGDVLYYLDKALVQDAFEKVFTHIRSWLEPGGRVLLAHGFAGDRELSIRQGYRERFEKMGLTLESETKVGDPALSGGVLCLLSSLIDAST